MKKKIIKRKDFMLLVFGNLITLLGSNMQQFALSLYVLEMTESATIFASILAISILPRLLFSPIAGVFGDWFDRKKVLILLNFTNALVVGSFAFIFFLEGNLTILLIYVLVIALEITEIFSGAAMSAVIPTIIEKENLLEANSVNSLVASIGQLFAPTIAALLYGFLGLFIVLIVNSLSFAITAISQFFIKIPKTNSEKTLNLKTFKTDLIDGLKIITGSKLISTIIIIAAIVNFTISPIFSIGLVFVIKVILQVTDIQFGFFQTIFALASIVAPILSPWLFKKAGLGKILKVCFIVVSILVILISIIPANFLLELFTTNFVPYAVLLAICFIVGILITWINIAFTTIFNHIVPLEAMGRTSSVLNLLVTILIPIGQISFGFLYDNIAASYVFIIGGSLMLLTILLYQRRLLEVDKLIGEKRDVPKELSNLEEAVEGDY